MANHRCPKCTLMPPCSHYESSEKVAAEAARIISSPKFKEVISPSKRNNLIKMVKSQHSPTRSTYEQSLIQTSDNQYCVDRVHNSSVGGDEALNNISINKMSDVKQAGQLEKAAEQMFATSTGTFGHTKGSLSK